VDNKYNVLIIGSGITGSALFYSLVKYTNIQNIAIVEKYDDIAMVNTNARGNSQTIHMGDIETNYPLEIALQTQKM
jgi:malate dehydrogenase (quinone)